MYGAALPMIQAAVFMKITKYPQRLQQHQVQTLAPIVSGIGFLGGGDYYRYKHQDWTTAAPDVDDSRNGDW